MMFISLLLSFLQRFGEFDAGSNTFQIPAKWQTALGCVVNVGSILGLQLAGWGSERYGYRVTMLVALFGLTGFLFIQFFVTSLPMLLVGYLLLGVSTSRGSTRHGRLIWCSHSAVPLGLFPDPPRFVCGRGDAGKVAPVLDNLCQPLLGYR